MHEANGFKIVSIHRLYLGHEFETPFYPGERLLVQDAGLIWRHNSWVDEAQEHGAAHRTNAVLWEPLTHHLCGGGWREQGERGGVGDKWGKFGTGEKGLSRGTGFSKGEEKILKMDFRRGVMATKYTCIDVCNRAE